MITTDTTLATIIVPFIYLPFEKYLYNRFMVDFDFPYVLRAHSAETGRGKWTLISEM